MDKISLVEASDELLDLASNHAEKYVNYVENLPFELQRNMTKLREIDHSCREIIGEMETLAANFTKEKEVAFKGRGTLLQIQRLFAKCQELGDEKIAITQQISETIDSRKKQVDYSAYRFKNAYRPDLKDDINGKRDLQKNDLHKGAKRTRRKRNYQGSERHSEKYERSSIDNCPLSLSADPSSIFGSSKSSLHLPLDQNHSPDEDQPPPRKSEKLERKELSVGNSNGSSSNLASSGSSSHLSKSSTSAPKTSSSKAASAKTPTGAPPSSAGSNGSSKPSIKGKKKKRKSQKFSDRHNRSPSPPEIPIDPDEPTYCLCGQVSFGQMIGCDNKKCPIEWFHFSCVGLTHNPKGKWYCPDCQRDRKKEAKHR